MADSYQSLDDSKIIQLALYEAADLTVSGQVALRAEIRRRKLGRHIEAGFLRLMRGLPPESLEILKRVVTSQPCPVCGSASSPLEAAEIQETVSIWLLAHTRESVKIGCPDCIRKMMRRALRKTLLLGWWSLPDGIIETGKTLWTHLRPARLRQRSRTEALERFVMQHAGYLYAYQHQEARILELLQHQHRI